MFQDYLLIIYFCLCPNSLNYNRKHLEEPALVMM